MTLHLTAFGPLRKYFGNEKRSLEMPAEATVRTVLETIDKIWGHTLPPDIWNRREKQFSGHITMLLNSARVADSSQSLSDDANLYLIEFMVGG